MTVNGNLWGGIIDPWTAPDLQEKQNFLEPTLESKRKVRNLQKVQQKCCKMDGQKVIQVVGSMGQRKSHSLSL